jgi:hypothetical protein
VAGPGLQPAGRRGALLRSGALVALSRTRGSGGRPARAPRPPHGR